MSTLGKAAGVVGVIGLGIVGYLAWRQSQDDDVPPTEAAPVKATRQGTWKDPCRPGERCVGPNVFQTKPIIYRTPSARIARRMESAAPGVMLTKERVIVDESTGERTTEVEAMRPTSARETEAVMRHIVAPSTAVTRPGGGGRGRAV